MILYQDEYSNGSYSLNIVKYDPQGPLAFIKKNNGPRRSIGHIQLSFVPVGFIQHFGPIFVNDTGLPVTANPHITGPIGGYGWLLQLSQGAPRVLNLTNFEIPPDSQLILGLSYPRGTSVTITAFADWCDAASDSPFYTCSEVFHPVSSHDQVRTSSGNAFFLDSNGLLTVRLISSPLSFTGNPQWIFPTWDTVGKWNSWYAIDRFSRDNITLPRFWYSSIQRIQINANCTASSQNPAYCATVPSQANISVCSSGYTQVAYDACCSLVNSTLCQHATA